MLEVKDKYRASTLQQAENEFTRLQDDFKEFCHSNISVAEVQLNCSYNDINAPQKKSLYTTDFYNKQVPFSLNIN